ncbi:MAG: molybdopterin-dependent oxidoreductase [Euryarchaeota archaeon]|nr:molybdopterin-dependent oxidoreductase [Euryarchaeota archaeon]
MKRTCSIVFCLFILILFSGCLSRQDNGNETEAAEYLGIELTPVSEQGNNAIKGTQFIDKDAYRLRIDGMVERPANLTYDQITTYTPVSKVVTLNCVEGWSFTAKWTGVPLKKLFDDTGIGENVTTVIFYSTDGYSTSHGLDYLIDNNIMLAYRINDITLSQDRGFPLQLVAEGKYGYKWAKWIDHIELVNASYKGYWESRGYNNKGDFGGPPFE